MRSLHLNTRFCGRFQHWGWFLLCFSSLSFLSSWLLLRRYLRLEEELLAGRAFKTDMFVWGSWFWRRGSLDTGFLRWLLHVCSFHLNTRFCGRFLHRCWFMSSLSFLSSRLLLRRSLEGLLAGRALFWGGSLLRGRLRFFKTDMFVWGSWFWRRGSLDTGFLRWLLHICSLHINTRLCLRFLHRCWLLMWFSSLSFLSSRLLLRRSLEGLLASRALFWGGSLLRGRLRFFKTDMLVWGSWFRRRGSLDTGFLRWLLHMCSFHINTWFCGRFLHRCWLLLCFSSLSPLSSRLLLRRSLEGLLAGRALFWGGSLLRVRLRFFKTDMLV